MGGVEDEGVLHDDDGPQAGGEIVALGLARTT